MTAPPTEAGAPARKAIEAPRPEPSGTDPLQTPRMQQYLEAKAACPGAGFIGMPRFQRVTVIGWRVFCANCVWMTLAAASLTAACP